MQHERLIADLHGMAGVVSALVARNDLEALGKQIDDLAFSFVAPLGADDCNHFRHKPVTRIGNGLELDDLLVQCEVFSCGGFPGIVY
jgi:hypothetical protein